MGAQPSVTRTVLPTAEALAGAVAQALVVRLGEAQVAGRVPAVALTGGTIAASIHRALADIGPGSGVDWGLVDFWWGDERFVAADSPDRNARDVLPLLAALGADPARVHPMPAADGLSLGLASQQYADELRQHGGGEFEVVMLGIGPDGHVASLFPGHRALTVEEQITVAVTDSPKPPPERISLTFEALRRTRELWLVASGTGKADAVRAAHLPGPVEAIPARGVRGRLGTVWWLDRDAAAAL
ncbi:6-phosphogluconolactonase [Nocardioides alcanivorans]|uniref:6-phosphogluconolactonase n=1 Tax=Nocardioides alcanivorans TaxID=2897352 RepID=UPI001F2A6CFE|nr:6-phosphogluconolactonase [Nocardioides alcanivorans]